MVILTKRKRIARRPDKAWQTKELLQVLMTTKGKSKRKTLSLNYSHGSSVALYKGELDNHND